MKENPYGILVESTVVHGETIHLGDPVIHSRTDLMNEAMKFYSIAKVGLITNTGLIYLDDETAFTTDGNAYRPGHPRSHYQVDFLEGLASTVEPHLKGDPRWFGTHTQSQ